MTGQQIDRRKIRRQAEEALRRERRSRVGPVVLNAALPTLPPEDVLALLDAVTRAEARADAKAAQTAYWQERALLFEEKMNELDRSYISEHEQRKGAEARTEAAEADRDRWRQTALEERAAALDLLDVIKDRDTRIANAVAILDEDTRWQNDTHILARIRTALTR